MKCPILSLFFVVNAAAVRSTGTRCMFGATVDNALFRASFLVFENVLMLRASLSEDALLASTLHCMGVGQDEQVKKGLQFLVMDNNGSATTPPTGIPGCNANQVYDPRRQNMSSQPSPSAELSPVPIAPSFPQCTPDSYEKDPWICLPGDWSGKFGELTLGLESLLYRNGRQSKLRRALSPLVTPPSYTSLIEEEVRVHVDQLAIPTCQLTSRYVGVFCSDGNLIGCAPFRPIYGQSASPAGAMEAGTKWLIRAGARHTRCHVLNDTPTQTASTTPSPRTTESTAPGWWSKDIGALPEYVSTWWEDVKKKSKEAWKASQIRR